MSTARRSAHSWPLARSLGVSGVTALLLLVGAACVVTHAAAQPAQPAGKPAPGAAAPPAPAAGPGGPLPPPPACPGIGGGVCTAPCQRFVCEALSKFFLLSYNATNPWTNITGWETTKTLGCARIVPPPAAAAAAARPPYCGWPGLKCCTPDAVARGACAVVNAIANLSMPVNQVNVSISNPEFLDAIEQLHACGLVVFDLEANEMSGSVPDRLGRLTNLIVLSIANNWITGTVPNSLGALTKLRRLKLGTNFLGGTIGGWVGALTQLEVLELGANSGENPPDPETGEERFGIIGTIPAGLGALTEMTVLDLQTNALQGTIPANLCGPTSKLRVLNLRSNQLTGPAGMLERCTALTQLDIGANMLTGNLPGTRDWQQLVVLSLGNNRFAGPIPNDIYFIPTLSYLDISDNELTGDLNVNINMLTFLKELDASHNNFTGEVGVDVFYLPQLTRLNLAHNKMRGTIADSIGLAFSLTELSLANNTGLVGPLPNEAGSLKYLRRATATNTGMSCVPREEAVRAAALQARLENRGKSAQAKPGTYPRCESDALLPCFLTFADYDTPRGDFSNMRCAPVLRKPAAQVEKDCPGGQGQLDDAADAESQEWELSPSYYQFARCKCLAGFQEAWSRNGTHLVCDPISKSAALPPWAWVLVALAAVLAALAAALALLGSRWVLFRSRWAREVELKRKRAKGPPKGGGPVSIVVTDIEGYSELMKTSPQLTTKALAMHNTALRKAAHVHAGHVFEQEGDSWAVAFHDAQDAVAFCMQSQQALHRVDWPAGLMEGGDHEGRTGTYSSIDLGTYSSPGSSLTTAGRGNSGATRARSTLANLSTVWAAMTRGSAAAAAGEGPTAWEQSLQLAQLQPSSRTAAAARGSSFSDHSDNHPSREASETSTSNTALPSITAPTGGAAGAGGAPHGSGGSMSASVSERDGSRSFDHDTVSISNTALRPASRGPSLGGSDLGTPHILIGGVPRPGLPAPAQDQSSSAAGASSLAARRQARRSAQTRFFNMLLGASQTGSMGGAHSSTMAGLRVRMGVATGVLAPGVDIRNSPVFDLAKVVSDLGNGGQVLIDAPTFDQVKDRMQELGAVDHYGYNDRLLVQREQGRGLCPGGGGKCSSVFCCAGPAGDGATAGIPDLLLMDMGEFEAPGVNVQAAVDPAAAAAAAAAARQQARSSSAKLAANRSKPRSARPSSDSAAGGGGGGAAADAARREGSGTSAGGTDTPVSRDLEAGGNGLRDTDAGGSAHAARRPSGGDHKGAAASAELAQRLRVYSVLPSCLSDRARIWAGRLAVKDGWRQTDRGFFDAPSAAFAAGVGNAHAGDGGAALGYELTPPVTVVFAAVEGAKSLLRWRRAGEAHAVAHLLRQVMLAALNAIPGGYLCREQEGELKYMLAFPTPARALQWCMVVQEAAMFAPWSAAVLAQPEYAEVHAPGDGTLLFRGPRLKMGACEGVPRGILCDHLGRVDYHGASVNQAARYMDAAAHGGQVVCDITLAEVVFREWRDAGGGANGAPAGPSSASGAGGAGPPCSSGGGAAAAPLSGGGNGGRVTPSGGSFANAGGVAGLLPLRQSSMTVLHGNRWAWVEGAAAASAAAAAAAPAPSASPRSPQAPNSGSNVVAAAASAHRSALHEEDELTRLAGRTFSGTELQRRRSESGGSVLHPGPAAPAGVGIHKHGSMGGRSSASGAGGAGALEHLLPPVLSPHNSLPSDAARSVPLQRVPSASAFPEEDPWPAAAAPLNADTLRQLSAQRLAQRQASWTNQGLGIAAGVPGLERVLARVAPDAARLSGGAQHPQQQQQPTAAPPVQARVASLRCFHIGSFRFKGSDDIEMVHVTTTALTARQGYLPRDEPKGKGRRVRPRAGMADAATTTLPDVLPALRETFVAEARAAAAAAAAARAAAAAAGGHDSGGGSGTDREDAAADYSAWLSRELARRRRFGGSGGGPLIYHRPPAAGAAAAAAGPSSGGGGGGAAAAPAGQPLAR